MKQNIDFVYDYLLCPETQQKLTLTTLDTQSTNNSNCMNRPVLLREDGVAAYPIENGIPILMTPERLIVNNADENISVGEHFSEAYEEMEYYNSVAKEEAENIEQAESYKIVKMILSSDKPNFLNPKEDWIDAVFDNLSQYDAYSFFEPVENKKCIQLGGKGIHAVKFLLGGASEAWLVTPMIGEVYCGLALAEKFGVKDKLRCVVAVCEELPLQNEMFDFAYSGGCLHHMTTNLAAPEIQRVLMKNGRFAAVDPWKTPWFTIGTKIFGKREVDVNCKPLTSKRVQPLKENFTECEIILHGAITRYFFLVLNKFGLKIPLSLTWNVF